MNEFVVHCKKEKYDVYIGRPGKWGNPFVIGKDGNRKQVLEKYSNYLLNNTTIANSIHELEGKILGCWCKPNDCHGDILASIANPSKSIRGNCSAGDNHDTL